MQTFASKTCSGILVMEFQALAPTGYYKTTRNIEKYKMITK